MSTAMQTTGALQLTDKFTEIFEAAQSEYQRITKKSLDTHPFAKKLQHCNNPEAVSNVFQTQAEVFSKSCKGDEKVMALLDPTIHILSTFSETLGEGIGLVRHSIRSARSFLNAWSSAILTRKNYFHRYRCSPHRKALSQVFWRACV